MSKIVKDPRAKYKKFINEKLIPFILREQGRGFVMEQWIDSGLVPGEPYFETLIERRAPKCGTVGCIGGSVELLKRQSWNRDADADEQAAAALGINLFNAKILFYLWEEKWPEPYRMKFVEAKTLLQQAKVACKFLKVIAEKGDAAFESATA